MNMGSRQVALIVFLMALNSTVLSQEIRDKGNAFREDAERRLVDLLLNEVAVPMRFAVQSVFLITEVSNDAESQVCVTDGVQVLAFDGLKRSRRVWLKASRSFDSIESQEDMEYEGFESDGKFLFHEANMQMGLKSQFPWQDSAPHGMGELAFFDPRNVWLTTADSYFLSCQSSPSAHLGKADSVASWKDKSGNLSAVYSCLHTGDRKGVNKVSVITWKDSLPIKVQLLPALRGDFSFEKLQRQRNKHHDQETSNHCSWMMLEDGLFVCDSVTLKSSHKGGSVEFAIQNTWLFGDQVRDTYLEDPRKNGAFELSRIDFKGNAK
jgi:hypothetical protein